MATIKNYTDIEQSKKLVKILPLDKWLNSLKDRVQPKQEWSEEDETYSDHIITAIKSYYTDDKGEENPWREELLRWFKERYAFKPSKRQMKDLAFVADQNKGNMVGKTMISLYKDLTKLTE